MKKLGIMLMSFVLVFSLAACGGSAPAENAGGETTDSGGQKQVTLNMWLFTGTGLEPLVDQYMKENPHVKVNIQAQEYADHHNGLVTALAAGSGAPDISMVEIGYLDRFKAEENNFHNLANFGANDIMGNYLDWKVVQASSQDGSFIFGLPTDVGPMAMMYRTDIFEQAGLPTDPAALQEKIKTWEDFITVGKTVKEATGKPMVDSILSVFDVVKGQKNEHYFDSKGELIAGTNPEMKKAYDFAVRVAQEGLSANIAQWTPEWGAGMNNGDFAVMLSPAWMMGFMKGNAPDSAGKWNVIQMPEGSGNWGGSFLTLPKQGKNAEEAYKLISWLLSPEMQLENFKTNGNFPSTPSIYDSEEIQTFSDPFFSDAPVGKIYAEAAQKVVPVYYGPSYVIANTPITNALGEVQNNNADPEAMWKDAITQIERELRR
ncbi:ABC transporter substrate-binding protein [Paenibacillus tarimensis]|uniref:ABC transporter substrate-binding protein n=1 Tax=Paenibacillus tarimensis TaxID=416012 RepID=UPI001F1C9C8B|nr:extracellular solute-binding protein [Paenibacillus tarimensis]MCF2945509.1 extracellular solute-binding protein [Paenibacillus tarimensis]